MFYCEKGRTDRLNFENVEATCFQSKTARLPFVNIFRKLNVYIYQEIADS